MPALPSSVIDPLWSQFKTLLPTINDGHPLGCHRRRVADRVIFDKLVTRLVLGCAYTKHADDLVSATTLRARRDEWIAHGVFVRLEQIVLEAFDQSIGLDLTHLSIDGCCVKAPCGGDNTGPNPTDRVKSGQKRSVLVEGHGLPIGVILAGANRHDSPTAAAYAGVSVPVWVLPARDDESRSRFRLRLVCHSRLVGRIRVWLEDLSQGNLH